MKNKLEYSDKLECPYGGCPYNDFGICTINDYECKYIREE